MGRHECIHGQTARFPSGGCVPCTAARSAKYKQDGRKAEWAKRNRQKHPRNQREYHAKWRTRNPEKWHALMALRRARKNGATVGPVDLALVLQDGKCRYCLRTDRSLYIDHIIPLAKGGAHVQENLAPACKPCNSRKHTSIVEPGAYA